jgi:hypothetical protein
MSPRQNVSFTQLCVIGLIVVQRAKKKSARKMAILINLKLVLGRFLFGELFYYCCMNYYVIILILYKILIVKMTHFCLV